MLEIYEEHTLASGEVITLTNAGSYLAKPWQVACYDSDECRWSKDFANESDARVEYHRFDK